MASVLKIAGLALVFCALLVAGLELGARLLLPGQVAAWQAAVGGQRTLFVSPGAFENHAGYFKFAPSRSIREVAYYPAADGSFTVEYDCTFQSDELGFVSNAVPYRESTILLLGDSLTHGSGGCAWLPRLAPELRRHVYSAAMLGHGVKHWRNILADLERIKRPERVLIVFIAGDFFREDWVHSAAQLACLSGAGDCRRQFWQPVSDRMAERAAERHALRNVGLGTLGSSRFWRQRLIATSTLIRRLRGKTDSDSQILRESLAIIADIAARYPLRMIWVNERDDVVAGGMAPRTRSLLQKLAGFDVVRCPLPPDGFLVRDGHPNAAGYDRLKGCVEDVVRDWLAAK